MIAVTSGKHGRFRPSPASRAENSALRSREDRRLLSRYPVTHGSTRIGVRNGITARIAGSVICRQRPGTAKGFVFLILEDETGISNAIVTPDIFDTNKLNIINSPYVLIDGVLQNQQNVVSVRAQLVQPLTFGDPVVRSKDFS
jgi:error-prone DNA polymerase